MPSFGPPRWRVPVHVGPHARTYPPSKYMQFVHDMMMLVTTRPTVPRRSRNVRDARLQGSTSAAYISLLHVLPVLTQVRDDGDRKLQDGALGRKGRSLSVELLNDIVEFLHDAFRQNKPKFGICANAFED
jgi:hypothetical protein